MKQYFNKTSVIQIAILLLLTLAIFMPITLAEIADHDITDYSTYLDIAKDISVNPKYWSEVSSNPGWTMMVLAVRNVLSIRHWKAALIVQMANQGLLALVLFFLAKEVSPERNRWLSVALPLGIMLAAPFFLIALKDHRLYFGYLGINSYHNPTTIALKPYALALFFISAFALEKEKTPTFQAIICLLSVVLSTLIKPSFIICLLPAAGIYFLVNLIRQKVFDWRTILFCIFIPSISVLAREYLGTYTAGDISVIFNPFVVMKNSSDFLLIKFLLSIWFPFIVLITYWKKALEFFAIRLAWLTFFFGASYTYLLAEGGWRIFHGNFTWSGEISLFILFVVSALFFFEQMKIKPLTKKWILVFIVCFLPHFISGLIYYGYCLMNNIYS
ncbi:MAG: hypothetical protein Q8N39_07955 [Pelolinea sp.]|nr:hypothetical protein [Pelolinea sp.]